MTTAEDKKRYYLHRSLKKIEGVSVRSRIRTIHIPYTLTDDPRIKELLDFKYNIQTEII
jgi:hypothetical protein